VYRPQPTVLQSQKAQGLPSTKLTQQVTPVVYRPQLTPKVLQTKLASAPQRPGGGVQHNPPKLLAYNPRPTPKSLVTRPVRPSFGHSTIIQRAKSTSTPTPTPTPVLIPTPTPPQQQVKQQVVDSRIAVIAALENADRLAWTVGQKEEFDNEVRTYAAELVQQYEQILEQKSKFLQVELNNRHKVSWDSMRMGLINAIKLASPDIVNSVLAVSGSWHEKPLSLTDGRWTKLNTDPKYAVAFLNGVGRSPLNVWTGNAKINKGSGSSIDPHYVFDPLGLSKAKDSSDGTATPLSAALLAVPVDDLFSGKAKMSDHLMKLFSGGLEHYQRLYSESQSESERLFFSRKYHQMAGHMGNWGLSFKK
jgi:hypothetical protein